MEDFPYKKAVVESDLLNLFGNYIPLPCYLVPVGQQTTWYGLTSFPNGLHPVQFELYFGKKQQRWDYNLSCFRKAIRTRKPVLSRHYGLYDIVVPILHHNKVEALVVSGSFSKKLPNEQWLREQWKALSGRQPGASDPEFLTYARVVLNTPILDDKLTTAYIQLLRCMGELALGTKDVEKTGDEIQKLKSKLFVPCLPTRMARYVSAKQDRLSWGPWDGEDLAPWDKEEFGLTRHPNTVLAVRSLDVKGAPSDLTRLIQAAELQRFAYEWVRDEKDLVAGPLEGEGCFILTSAEPKKNHTQAQLHIRDLAERFSRAVMKTLKLRILIGVSHIGAAVEEMPEHFHQALTALRFAAHSQKSPYFFESLPEAPRGGLYGLSRALVEAIGQGKEGQVPMVRGQFVQEALRLSSGNPESLRINFLQFFYLVWDEMFRHSIMNKEEFEAYRATLEERLGQAFFVEQLLDRFNEGVDQAVRFFQSPAEGSRSDRMETARRYMELNCRRRLTIQEVAKEAGFSVSRFSHLFKELFGESFIDAFTRMRCEAAGRTLKTSSLSISQVAQSYGFGTSSHFTHIFKQRMGCTPLEYRQKALVKEEVKS